MNAGSVLSTLTSTQGVRGVAVFDGAGSCVASELPPPYEPILVADAVRRIASASDVFTSLTEGALDTFSARCEGGLLILRRVTSFWVLTLASPGVNINLLNVALNVLALNLARSSGGPPPIQSGMSSSNISGMYGSQMLTASQSIPDAAIPPDAVGRERVIELLRAYTLAIGPAAKVLLKQQLAELGVSSRTLRIGQMHDLVMRLATKIPTAERQQEFVDAVRAIMPS